VVDGDGKGGWKGTRTRRTRSYDVSYGVQKEGTMIRKCTNEAQGRNEVPTMRYYRKAHTQVRKRITEDDPSPLLDLQKGRRTVEKGNSRQHREMVVKERQWASADDG
jgi:hypothetical protein